MRSTTVSIKYIIQSILALLLLVMGVSVVSAAESKPPFPTLSLPGEMRGTEAVKGLGDKLPAVAAWYGMTPQAFADMMKRDPNARLDQHGRLFYVDEFPIPPQEEEASGASGPTVSEGPYPAGSTLMLHSKPGSKRVIYLDFTGYTTSNTAWNSGASINAVPFDIDGDPTTFSTTELDRIQYIWQRVAEDYAPFDVDVTTEEPAADLLNRTSSTDAYYGTRAVITKNTFYSCSCGGVAYVGVFNYSSSSNPTYYQPAWVFYDALGTGNEKYVAEAISHEVGHNLGLSHDGTTTGSAYYSGNGSGATGWAPIMGVGYYQQVTQWSKGEYPDANNSQDDLTVIPSYGAALRADDHGNTTLLATGLTVTDSSTTRSLSGNGIIESRSDVDVFSFYAGAGNASISLSPSPRGPNLDASVTLLDSAGNEVTVLAVGVVPVTLSATLAQEGNYFLKIDGIGYGTTSVGYSDYASLGQYSISGTVPLPGSAAIPPQASADASPLSGTAPLLVSFNDNSIDVDGSIVSWRWDFGDGSSYSSNATGDTTHTYTSAGTYTAMLTVTDNTGLSASTPLTITVNPAAVMPISVSDITMGLVSNKSGTNATASVLVIKNGLPVSGATVNGSWSGIVSGNVSGVTGTNGRVVLKSAKTRNSGTFVFTINTVSKNGETYESSLNKENSDSIIKP
jgi:PKD repeat protein